MHFLSGTAIVYQDMTATAAAFLWRRLGPAMLAACCTRFACAQAAGGPQVAQGEALLPDAPSAVVAARQSGGAVAPIPAPCPTSGGGATASSSQSMAGSTGGTPCPDTINSHQRFLNSSAPQPLTVKQKGVLAARNFSDPFNLVFVGLAAGVAQAADAHSAYGPGMTGWGKRIGVNMTGSLEGEFFGTFLISSIAHQDPRYHRMPGASPARRVLHAISRTAIAQSDNGKPMPNYAVALTYPIVSELANAYVPGIQRDARANGERILLGYATDPVDNLVTEFLPDLAKRIHVRVVFFQQIINSVATDSSAMQ